MRIGPRVSLAICFVLVIASTGQAQPEAANVALLAGVNLYDSPEFSALSFAERDVTVLGDELRKHGFTVVVLTGSDKGDGRATKENILAKLRGLSPKPNRDAVTLVMLSGHGQQLRSAASDGQFTDENYFCPVDGVSGEADTLVSLSEITDGILRKYSGRNLLLIDACRDLAEVSRAKGIQGRDVALPEDIAVLFSCRAGQRSYESTALGHGLFTYCVLEGLRGKAADNGEVDWDGLTAYVKRRLKSKDMRDRMSGGPQDAIDAGGVDVTRLARVIVPSSDPFAGSTAGAERDDNGLALKLVWCPPGLFTMGSPRSQPDRQDDEDPVPVTLTRGFWLGKTEVTQKSWQAVMGTTPWSGKEFVRERDDYPATYVGWDDATEFCRKLTNQERQANRLPAGWSYVLPTEAQWEYACRAGAASRFAFGDDDSTLPDFAWFQSNAWDADEQYAHQVGGKSPNAWGLHDMHGNVGEWCRDWYPEKLPGGTDPEVAAQSLRPARAYRGGSWGSAAAWCRAALRCKSGPARRNFYIGFRIAASP